MQGSQVENLDLSAFSNIFQITLTAIVTLGGAYLVYKNRTQETKANTTIAKINNEDDLINSYGALQAQLNAAARNMVQPLNEQINELTRRLTMANEETKQLREYVKEKSQELEVLTRRVLNLETENAALRGDLARSKKAESNLRQRLEAIKREIDTGPLSSGVHKIPTEDDNDGN